MMTFLSSERFWRLSKEGSWIIGGDVIAVLGTLVGMRLLTGMLSPSAYGELALGMTVAILVCESIFVPLFNGVTRFYAPAKEQGDLGGFLNAVCRLTLSAFGVIVLLIVIAVVELFVIGRAEWVGLAVAAFIFAFLPQRKPLVYSNKCFLLL